MNPRIIPFAFTFLLSVGLHAQTATDLNEGLSIRRDSATYPTLPFELTWWARPDFYYFVLQTDDLREKWSYHDYAVKGTLGADGLGDVEGFRFDSSSSMLFFRIEFTNTPSDEVLLADFDGDFISNKDELDQGTDVFGMLFSDADLLPDEWELFWFGNLLEGDSGDGDGDGLTNLEESRMGGNPGLAAIPASAASLGLSIFSPR
jgi:hypothetical protein